MSKRLRRSESFFGMHFDFHAGKDQRHIGARLDEDSLEELMTRVRPDYVQCDTKGHSGNTSYPTRVGYPAPEMDGDILRLWRKVTARHGVALYAHHSGVWDHQALAHHPDWAACQRDGTPSPDMTSVFGPYAEELLIPQLKEMALEYGLDGAWIDGECWAVMEDYSVHALAAWKAATGKDAVTEEDGEAYTAFCRQGFRDYVTRYIDAVHAVAPDFEIASNWMYTSYTPEERTVPVDFLSGDYAPSDSTAVSRLESRCVMGQDRPWDLMAWGFTIEGGYHAPKELNQLCQEAATVISLGGGFQVYNRQLEDSVQRWAIPMWAELARFCRARQAICHKAVPVPQAAVVFSVENYYHDDPTRLIPFQGAYYKEIAGNLGYLLDNQFSVEVKKTHQLMGDLSAYGLIVVPDGEVLEPELIEKLTDYARRGGNLLLSGPRAAGRFAHLTEVTLGELHTDAPLYVAEDGFMTGTRGDWCGLSCEKGACLAYGYQDGDDRSPRVALAYRLPVGEGTVTVSGLAVRDGYLKHKSAGMRRYFARLADAFAPAFTVTGSHLVEAALMEKDGCRNLNLTNLAGSHEDARYRGFDEIPPLGPLTVQVRCPTEPTGAVWLPEGIPAAYTWENGVMTCTLPRLAVHTVLHIPKGR